MGLSLLTKLVEIRSSISNFKQEATLRQTFFNALNSFLQDNNLGWAQVLALFQLEETIIKGRSDARLGQIVFEFKLPKPKGAGIEKAIDQAKGYIFEHRKKGEVVRGVGYDGIEMALLNENGGIIFKGELENATPILESWVLLLGGKTLKPEDMVNVFGFDSPNGRYAIMLLYNTFKKFQGKIKFIDEVFDVWKELYGCAANINKEAMKGINKSGKVLGIEIRKKRQAEEYVFILETYLAILLKLFIARIAAQRRLVTEMNVSDLIKDPEGNYLYRYIEMDRLAPQLLNVFEEDVFLWFGDAARADSQTERFLSNLIQTLADSTDNIDLAGMNKDFLRLFYQRFFDPATRIALGEFYTSMELVDETLDAIGYEGDLGGIVADISVGSGSFLVGAISRAIANGRRRKPDLLLKDIIDNFVGIDIHPLAVAMARVNFVIAIAELLTPDTVEKLGSIKIPVYWADSLLRLSIRKFMHFRMEGMPLVIPIQIPGVKAFSLPSPDDVSWYDLFGICKKLISKYKGAIVFDEIWHRFTQEFDQEKLALYERTLKDFLMQLVDRHNNGKDTRWLPLLENVLEVERLIGGVKYLVGNPPWVRIHNIDKDLRERINKEYDFCKLAGWSRGSGLAGISRGFARQIDLCVPFVERGIELLSDKGRLGFLITSKIQQSLYANELRKELVENNKVLKVIDYSLHSIQLFEDATNYPLILGIEKSCPNKDTTTTLNVINPAGERSNYLIKQSSLPLLADDPESPWIIASKEFRKVVYKLQKPKLMFGTQAFSRPIRGVMTSANDIFISDSVVLTDDKDEVSAKLYWKSPIRLEKSLFRPTLRGRDICAWKYKPSSYLLWTHDDNGKALKTLPKKASEYFAKPIIVNKLKKRSDYKSNLPVWSIFRVSKSKLGHKVAWCELTDQMESVSVEATYYDSSMGKTLLLVPLQTVYFIPLEDKEVAAILAAFFNSTIIRSFLCSYAERARGGYFRHIGWTVALLPLPPKISMLMQDTSSNWSSDFDLKRLLQISKKLHNTESCPKDLKELDSTVGGLFGLNEADIETLREYFDFTHRGIKESRDSESQMEQMFFEEV